MSPVEEYRARLTSWGGRLARAQRQYSQFGNARLGTGIAAVLVVGFSIGVRMISPWWLMAPLVIFVALAIALHRLDSERQAATRGVAYYERAIGRMEDRWMGTGSQGERFRDAKHVYADDLDLFGRGSLFELLSTARTGAGERTLAEWLLGPGEREEVEARQAAVKELRPRIDLREEIALMGEDVQAAVDARGLAAWGMAPPVRFFPGARLVAPALACAALVTLGLFFAQQFSVVPFLLVVLAEMLFSFPIRPRVGQVKESVSAPAHELKMLALLLEKLEQEQFTSARMMRPVGELKIEGSTASRRIRRLTRLIELLDSSENMFFRPIAAHAVVERAVRDGGGGVARGVRAADWSLDRGGGRVRSAVLAFDVCVRASGCDVSGAGGGGSFVRRRSIAASVDSGGGRGRERRAAGR